ncbi:hypothetical protein NWFMUON74_64210 [Nocardia wallacei]|uniref:Uncharacterized protein n=1 Tax=Nocardia wallacei TaxID=480035 RepID=A0A7G1KX91_9NOCA|nr:hypothetical protein NWFMUON74_64210 [Nocardia wallacei]
MHRGLGDAVHVDQSRHRITVAGNPIGEAAQLQRLTAEDHVAQRQRPQLGVRVVGLLLREFGGSQLIERRRGLVEHRDPFAAQQFQELLRRTRGVVVDHHQGAAEQQRTPQLPHREVEGVGVEHRPHVAGTETELAIGIGEQPHHVPVLDRDALGAAGRSGGVDDVGDVLRGQRRDPVGVGDRALARVDHVRDVHAEVVHQDARQPRRQLDIDTAVDDHARGRGIREHVGDAVGRVVRIDRDVTRAGLDHREQRDDEIGRARQQHGDQRLGARAVLDQPARQLIRALVQRGVGDPVVTEGDGDPVGVRGHGGVEQVRQRRGAIVETPALPVCSGGDPALRDIQPLGLTEQVDVADDGGRILGDAAQDPHEAVGERGDRLGIEQVGGVVPRQRQIAAGGGRADGQLHIEFRCARVEFDHLEVESGQSDAGGVALPGGLEGQRDLEQRMVRLRAHRAQHVDQLLERHVGVRERGQIGATDLVEQFGEGRAGTHLGAQHQRVDEHTDQVVEGALATARDRGADGDVGAAGLPCGPGRQRRVHQHEQGDAARAGQLHQRRVQLAVDRELVCRTGVGGDLGPRPVGGQLQLIGQIAQLLGPVGDLAGRLRLRIAFVAEDLALPQRVVGVLHLERRPLRDLALRPRGVGGDDIAQQRPQREAVRADVVGHQHHDVLAGSHREQRGPERQITGDIEEHAGQRGHPGGQLVRRDGLGGEVEGRLADGQHALVADALHLGVDGAQRLVPGQHVAHGGGEGRHVQLTGHPDRDRDVVDGGAAVEPVQEPHPLLCGRERHQPRLLAAGQRHRLGALPRGERRPAALSRMRFHARGEGGHGRGIEQQAHRHLGVEGRAEAGGDLGGDQRVAAQFEEVVVETDSLQPEQFADGVGHGLFGRGDRRAEHLGGEGRCGQRAAVQLAGGVERELVEHHERRRHHVHRKALRQLGFHRFRGDRRARSRDQVGDQLVTGAFVGTHHHDGLGDGVEGGERRLDLAQFDALAAQLHLEVGAAQVFQLTGRGPHHQVAGAVQAFPVAERAGDEPVRGQVRARHITARQLRARQIQLTRDTHRHRLQPLVQHVDLGVEHRRADRHRAGVGVGDLVIGHVDGGLGRTVQIVQPRPGQLPQPLRGRSGQCLAGGEDVTELELSGTLGGYEDRQHGGDEVGDRDALGGDEVGQVGRVAVAVGLGHHQPGADLQRPEELPHRHVEGGRGLLQHHVVGGQAVLGVHPDQAVDDGRVAHRHALRPAGRTGGEDHVRGVRRIQRRHAIGVGERPVGEFVQLQPVDLDRAVVDRQVGRVTRGGQHPHRAGRVEDVAGPVGRVVRVQRHVRATGRRHRVHADDQVDGAPHAQRDKRFRSDTGLDQPARQPVHPGGELGIGQTCPLERHRGRLGTARHLGLEQRHQGRGGVVGDPRQRRVQRELGVVPVPQHQGVLGGIEQFQIADTQGRVGGHAAQHAQEPLHEGFGELGVEKICGVDEFGVHRRGVGRLLGQRQLHVELRRRRVDTELGHRQAGQFQRGVAEVLEGQHHLEQRVTARRASGLEHLHQPFERHPGVREGGQVALAHLGQQLGERSAGVDLVPQHEGVDHHADQIVERLLATTGDRRADRDVGGAAQSGQQSREGAVHHHEQRGAVTAGDRAEAVDQRAGHLEPVCSGLIRGECRAGPGRQAQFVRQTGQRAAPVVELLGDQRPRVVLGAERIPLPQRVIHVLDGQRRPVRHLARGARQVRGHQVAHQRAHGETVGGDVVGDHDQDVVGGVQFVDAQAHGRFRGDVEPAGDEFAHHRQQFVGVHGDHVDVRGRLGGRQHLLVADAVGGRVDGAQRFVPRHHVRDRAAQRVQIEVAGEADRDGDVVGGGIGVEPVQEPHALLCQRQRRALGPGAGRERLAHAGSRARADPGGQPGHRGRLEQHPHPDLRVERGGQPGGDLGGDQRVAAESEEVVVGADAFDTEQIGEDARHDLLERRGRGPVVARRQFRFRQRLAIQLAHRGQRYLVEHHDGRRHHVGRKPIGHVRRQCGDIHGPAGDRAHVGHQERRARVVVAADRHREVHVRVGGQRGVDLAQLDAETADLHLEVVAAHVFHDRLARAVAPPAHHVAGAVQPLARRAVRVGHEAVGGQCRAREVAARQLDAAHVQFADHALGHRPQPRVQHQRAHTAHRAADGHQVAGQQPAADVGGDRRLGRAVGVVQPTFTRITGHHRPFRDQVGRQCLATGDDRAHAGEGRRIQRGQHRRGDQADRDALARDQLAEFVTAVGARRHHDQRTGRADGQQQFQHRGVERR